MKAKLYSLAAPPSRCVELAPAAIVVPPLRALTVLKSVGLLGRHRPGSCRASLSAALLLAGTIATAKVAAAPAAANLPEPAAEVSPAQIETVIANVETELAKARKGQRGQSGAVKQQALDALVRAAPPADPAGRSRLAEAWARTADLVRETEGTTPFLAEIRALAAQLDPDNPTLAREAAFENRRQAKIQARLDEARRLREAKSARSGNREVTP